MKLNLILVSINLVHVFVFNLELNSCVKDYVHIASLFWVGKATKMTIFTPCIIVME